MIEQIVTRTAHLERTSESDSVPAEWAAAEIRRALASIPPESRSSAMVCGWRNARIDYQHRRTDLEVAQERAALLVQALRLYAATGMTSEQIEALIEQAG